MSDSSQAKIKEDLDAKESLTLKSAVIGSTNGMNLGQVQYDSFYENAIMVIRPAIEKQIKAFEAELEKLDDPYLYVGLRLTVFGQHRLILVQKIEFEDPFLVIFHGIGEDGVMLKLIQHISQLNFLLESSKRGGNDLRKPIGFSPECSST